MTVPCSLHLGLIALLAVVLWASTPVCGQQLAPDSTMRRPLMPFRGAEHATTMTDSAAAHTIVEDVVGLLAEESGSFSHDFGAFGWPNAWSPYGMNPQKIALQLGGLPFDDLITGRPRYDLLPTALLEPLGLQPGRHGAPLGVAAELRSFEYAPILTELHYQSGSGDLQRIAAAHRQQRSLGSGSMDVLFAYGGGAATGEYPGSKLHRMRQVLLRARAQQPDWSLEATWLHNQRRLGAHGGVIPGVTYASIYNRLTANVENGDATRRTVRNDLALTLRVRLLAEPLTAQVFHTAQTFRYHRPRSDTLSATAMRIGGRLAQDILLGPHALRVVLEGWTDRLLRSNVLPDDLARTRLHATLRDSVRFGSLSVLLEGGVFVARSTALGGGLHMSQQLGEVRLFADLSHSGDPASWVHLHGWGRFADGAPSVTSGRHSLVRAGLALQLGGIGGEAFGFAHMQDQGVEAYLAGEDSIAVRTMAGIATTRGVGGEVWFRRNARRGFYLRAMPTMVVHPGTLQETPVPSFFVHARLGARYLLFQGDLDLNASIRVRYWTAMRGRALHAPTGMLVFPGSESRLYPAAGKLPASGALDVVIEGTVRTARLFVAYENVLSGTQLLVGNQIVPLYPLPERRFRFGVFWPIAN